jgi:hypothetical protein
MTGENEAPIQKQRKVNKWQLDEIERLAGRRPTEREVKEELARAVPLGRLRYMKGYGKQMAGYFPLRPTPKWCDC